MWDLARPNRSLLSTHLNDEEELRSTAVCVLYGVCIAYVCVCVLYVLGGMRIVYVCIVCIHVCVCVCVCVCIVCGLRYPRAMH